MALTAPTQHDTYEQFIGSGALDYHPWYQEITEFDNSDCGNEGWFIHFTEYDDDGPVTDDNGKPLVRVLNHAKIIRAIADIAGTKKRPTYVGPELISECQTFHFGDPEDCDFDADTADQVMQLAAFGEIRYG